MECWEEEVEKEEEDMNNNKCQESFVFQVLTDDQLEVLRQQISLYATISHSLVHMHNSFFHHHTDLSGMKLGGMESLYCESLLRGGGHKKYSTRQRWNPTPGQLQILDKIFHEEGGNPSKQKVKDITSQLSQHGPICETNVYNWFQNRRARSKRKQSVLVPSDHNDAPDHLMLLDPLENKNPEMTHSHELSSAALVNNTCLQIPEISTDMLISLDAISNDEGPTIPLDFSLTSSATQGLDHLHGILESPADFISYWQDEYDMLG